MAILVTKTSTRVTYLLEGGKIVLLEGANSDDRLPELEVSDDTFTNLVSAYGAVVGS